MKNILDNVCQLVYQKKYKDAEKLLVKFIEETLKKSSHSDYLIYLTIYKSFNEYYLGWLKKNKIDFKTEKQLFKTNGSHVNYFIAKSSKSPEMDDLLYEFGNYLENLDSKEQKKEVLYHLQCYKRRAFRYGGTKIN